MERSSYTVEQMAADLAQLNADDTAASLPDGTPIAIPSLDPIDQPPPQG